MTSKIVFFGNERLATGVGTTNAALRGLLANGYNVVAVVAHQDAHRPSRRTQSLEVAELAGAHDIPVLLPARPAEIADQLRGLGADVAVLVAYGRIIPQSVIDIFPRGIINIHPSLLPLHRGPTPIESAILAGASQTGVSIMQLGATMDAGPVFGQTTLPLQGTETKQALADELLQRGADLLVELLPGILDGSVAPTAQADEQATYDQLLQKSAGQLDCMKPAVQLEREIRALAEWPKSRTVIADREVVITRAHVTAGDGQPGAVFRQDKLLGLYTSDGILIIDELKPAGKQAMSAAAFLAGYLQ